MFIGLNFAYNMIFLHVFVVNWSHKLLYMNFLMIYFSCSTSTSTIWCKVLIADSFVRHLPLHDAISCHYDDDDDDDDEFLLRNGWPTKGISLISSRDHSQIITISNLRHTASRFNLHKNLNSGFVEWSYIVVIISATDAIKLIKAGMRYLRQYAVLQPF